MNNTLNTTLKITVSVVSTSASAFIGFVWMIPITQVDALIAHYVNSESVLISPSSVQSLQKLSIPPSTAYTTDSNQKTDPSSRQNGADNLNRMYSQLLISAKPDTESSHAEPSPYKIRSTGITAASQLVTLTPSSISIPALGLHNVTYSTASLLNIQDIDDKLLRGPVQDTAFGTEPCQANSHTYLMGHSQPAYAWQAPYPGTSIFGSLHTLKPGDIITITNSQSTMCSYQVTGWEKAITEDDKVSHEEFYKILFPDTSSDSVLSIQTCQLGSATVRLILRAKMV